MYANSHELSNVATPRFHGAVSSSMSESPSSSMTGASRAGYGRGHDNMNGTPFEAQPRVEFQRQIAREQPFLDPSLLSSNERMPANPWQSNGCQQQGMSPMPPQSRNIGNGRPSTSNPRPHAQNSQKGNGRPMAQQQGNAVERGESMKHSQTYRTSNSTAGRGTTPSLPTIPGTQTHRTSHSTAGRDTTPSLPAIPITVGLEDSVTANTPNGRMPPLDISSGQQAPEGEGSGDMGSLFGDDEVADDHTMASFNMVDEQDLPSESIGTIGASRQHFPDREQHQEPASVASAKNTGKPRQSTPHPSSRNISRESRPAMSSSAIPGNGDSKPRDPLLTILSDDGEIPEIRNDTAIAPTNLGNDNSQNRPTARDFWDHGDAPIFLPTIEDNEIDWDNDSPDVIDEKFRRRGLDLSQIDFSTFFGGSK